MSHPSPILSALHNEFNKREWRAFPTVSKTPLIRPGFEPRSTDPKSKYPANSLRSDFKFSTLTLCSKSKQ
ncbi:hypothetical protein RRG08_007129 [Elysia crispata]|uniref:Uncharacterized protein n=1 Tax=Elysia crispata TaxID=231223 RepID=A0AAE0Y7A3_9GAST|nr:hypothetical protein RRG08_007129 [Elysia crispata]